MNLPSFDFTNWREHPTDNRYTIFFFKTEQESNFFQNLLDENKIWYEFNLDENEPNYKFYFAVNKVNEKQVIQCNHLAVGEYRKPFIQIPLLRYTLVVLMILVLILAFIGYLKTHS